MKKNAVFTSSTAEEMDATVVTISGPIDETAVFDAFRTGGTMKVDLAGVTRINSVGIRVWCLWLQRFREPTDVILVNCPMCMVANFAKIRGFLTPRCKVFSFAVPFYSEATGERRDYIATWKKDFSKGTLTLPELNDSRGNKMVLDVDDGYFKFLKL
jgi:ABC-type transporter Mla MlaB component